MALIGFLLCLGFPALLAAAAVCDLARYRIPNTFSIALALLYLPAALAVGTGLEQIAWHLVAGLIVLLVGMALFFAGLFGGADAKMLAAAACWTGFPLLVPFLIVMALAGGVLALVLLALRLVLARTGRQGATTARAGWITRQLERPKAVPYGLAIAVGGIAVFGRLPTVIDAIAMP
mgnify:CR=1 FL=1|jgi:prepilin peptidase CpaA